MLFIDNQHWGCRSCTNNITTENPGPNNLVMVPPILARLYRLYLPLIKYMQAHLKNNPFILLKSDCEYFWHNPFPPTSQVIIVHRTSAHYFTALETRTDIINITAIVAKVKSIQKQLLPWRHELVLRASYCRQNMCTCDIKRYSVNSPLFTLYICIIDYNL